MGFERPAARSLTITGSSSEGDDGTCKKQVQFVHTKMTVTCGVFHAYGDGEDCKDTGTYLSLEAQKESEFGGGVRSRVFWA